MKTLQESWGMQCPRCKSSDDNELHVRATVALAIRLMGNEHCEEEDHGDNEWDDASECWCDCGWSGVVADAKPSDQKELTAAVQYQCPNCSKDDGMMVETTSSAMLGANGATSIEEGKFGYKQDSKAYCRHCGHEGVVAHFKITQPTVKDIYSMLCPECGKDDRLRVATRAWADLTPEGAQNEQPEHEWNESSDAMCGCGWAGNIPECHRAYLVSVVDRLQ